MGREPQGLAALSPAQRALAASLGSLTRWSRVNTVEARRKATEPARAARLRSLERQADPDGALSPAELKAAVDRLRRAHFRRMALASARSRRGSS
jgi:hypothetical protein